MRPVRPVRELTHPERVMDADSGVTKLELAGYADRVSRWMAPHLAGRPVAVVRAPDGLAGEVFFQKNAGRRVDTDDDGIETVAIDPRHDMFLVTPPAGLWSAVQWNVIEFHTVGAVAPRMQAPDRVVFDLDPGDGVGWPMLVAAARVVRVLLLELGLRPFLKTSGGRGLHLVAPVRPGPSWSACKLLAKAVADHLADARPELFVAVSGPDHRVGRIFVDYLRNQPGATTVAAWSPRARPGLPVSVPVAWDELRPDGPPLRWTVRDVVAARPQGNAPWTGYGAARRSLAAARTRLTRLTGVG